MIARLDPRTRVVLAGLMAVTAVAAQTVAGLSGLLALSLALAVLARLPALATARRMLALEGFMVLVLVMLPFTVPGRPVAEVMGLAASAEGLERALVLMLKANAAALAVLALLGSMEPHALGRALGRLGAPERLVALFLFTIRYIQVLGDEHRRLRTAMRARAFRPATGLHCWRSLGQVFGMLLVRALERAERIDAAMRLRGFTGRFPVLEEAPAGALDWGFGAASTAALAALLVLA